MAGVAEADQMRMKAAAYKQYGDAAVTALVLESLPKVMTSFFISSFCLIRTTVLTEITPSGSYCNDAAEMGALVELAFQFFPSITRCVPKRQLERFLAREVAI